MNPPSRRQLLSISLAAGLASSSRTGLKPSNPTDDAKPDELTRDQQFVMQAGMTREEAECWKLTAEAAGTFFQLPELHPNDAREVAEAIHVIQNKLLARPTYRKYLEVAKADADQRLDPEKK
jgi:hypothetical protein